MSKINLSELDDYDWKEAFSYAGGPGMGTSQVDPVPGAKCSADPFGIDDVVYILALEEGENDGANWICVGTLKDKRWFFLSAGCDYTGWDCQAGGNATVADTKKEIIRLGMGAEDRRRLHLEIKVE